MVHLIKIITSKQGRIGQDLFLLTLLFGTILFQFLGKFPLMEPDEGRYAEIPREMLERGDFITPTLNYVKYLEKPPLHYWLNALSISLLGQNEFAVRLPGAICCLLTILTTYWIGRELFGRREGFLAALVLGSATGFLVQGRINFTDMTLTFCMTAAAGSFLLASRPHEPKKGVYYHLFYLFCGLAFLAKGLIGIVLPGGIVFLYMLFVKRWVLLKEMRVTSGLPLLLAAVLPWAVLASVRNPEFFRFFFIREHFTRFLTTVHERYEPFWYFMPILLLVMLPWSAILPQALFRACRDHDHPGRDRVFYLLIWAGFIFFFFSTSNSKLIPYILPVIPPLALLTGLFFSRIFDGEPIPARAGLLFSALLLVAGCGAIAYPHFTAKGYITASAGTAVGAIFMLQAAALLLSTVKREGTGFFLALFAGGLLLSLIGSHTVMAGYSARKASSRELCRTVRDCAGPDTAVVSFGYEQGLPFYAGRRVIVAGPRGELEFGAAIGDQSAWFIDQADFPQLWDSDRHVIALLKPEELLATRTVVSSPVKILGQDPRRVLITNRF